MHVVVWRRGGFDQFCIIGRRVCAPPFATDELRITSYFAREATMQQELISLREDRNKCCGVFRAFSFYQNS